MLSFVLGDLDSRSRLKDWRAWQKLLLQMARFGKVCHGMESTIPARSMVVRNIANSSKCVGSAATFVSVISCRVYVRI